MTRRRATPRAAAPRRARIWPVVWAAALAAVLGLYLLRDRLPWAVNYPDRRGRPVADWISALDGAGSRSTSPGFTRSHHRGARRAAGSRARSAGQSFKIGHGARRRLSCRGCPGSASARRPSSPAMRSAAGGWRCGRRLLPLYRAVRPVGQRHADAGADRHRRAALRRHRACSLGIWAGASPAPNGSIVSPALDLMQTIPTFAYLIPMLLLFGNSPVSAMIATAIFATPPMVRATMLGAVAGAGRDRRFRPTWPAAPRARSSGACCCPRRGRR